MAEKNPPPTPAATPAEVRLDLIDWGAQPREAFDGELLAELAANMKARGLLCPIRLRTGKDGRYQGVCGERRTRAARMLGWETIPAVVADRDVTEAERTLEQLSENLFRDDLQPVELAKSYQRVMQQQKWKAKELAAALGVSPAKVSQSLRLLDLPADIQADVDRGTIPATTAYEIAKAPAAMQADLACGVKMEQLTRDQVKAAAGAKAAGSKREPFRASLPGNHFDFEVDGNRIVVRGKTIDSARLLADAVGELAAAVRALARPSEPADAKAKVKT